MPMCAKICFQVFSGIAENRKQSRNFPANMICDCEVIVNRGFRKRSCSFLVKRICEGGAIVNRKLSIVTRSFPAAIQQFCRNSANCILRKKCAIFYRILLIINANVCKTLQVNCWSCGKLEIIPQFSAIPQIAKASEKNCGRF